MRQQGLLQGQRLHGCRNLQQRNGYLRVRSRVCRLHMCHLPWALQWHTAQQQWRYAGNLLLQHRSRGQTRSLLQLR